MTKEIESLTLLNQSCVWMCMSAQMKTCEMPCLVAHHQLQEVHLG